MLSTFSPITTRTSSRPLANYPTKWVSENGKTIIGVYNTYVIELENDEDEIHVLNVQIADKIIRCRTVLADCQGKVVDEKTTTFQRGSENSVAALWNADSKKIVISIRNDRKRKNDKGFAL